MMYVLPLYRYIPTYLQHAWKVRSLEEIRSDPIVSDPSSTTVILNGWVS
jgi:hypothetical protein